MLGEPVPGRQPLPAVLAMDGWGRLATGGNGARLNGGGQIVAQVNGAGNGYYGVAAASVQPMAASGTNGAGTGSGLRKMALAGIVLGVAAGAVLRWRGGGAQLRASAGEAIRHLPETMQHLPEAVRIAGLNQGFAEVELAPQLPVDIWRQRLADFIAPAPPAPPPPQAWHQRLRKRFRDFSARRFW